jgi:hypothetical protein
MKKVLFVLGLLVAGSAMAGDVYVQPHVNRNGTYVQGYHRSAPDSNPYNNYSTHGNVNPYTGQAGTVNPYQQQDRSSGYGQQQRCSKDMYGNVTCF